MNILVTCSSYNHQSGSPMYSYELTRELKSRGHEVTLVSNVGGEITDRSRALGVYVIDFRQYESFRHPRYDVIHTSQLGPTQFCIDRNPGVPCVVSVHSEYRVEFPLVNGAIRRYVAIRPSVRDVLTRRHGVPGDMVEVIYNPIDCSRFNPDGMPDRSGRRRATLFVGTVDPLRRRTIERLMDRAAEEDTSLRIVGDRHDSYLDGVLPPHVTWRKSHWDIEDDIKRCDETAGILYGRTTIEGLLCGKPGWVFDVRPDSAGGSMGEVVSEELLRPDPMYRERHDSALVVGRIEAIYRSL